MEEVGDASSSGLRWQKLRRSILVSITSMIWNMHKIKAKEITRLQRYAQQRSDEEDDKDFIRFSLRFVSNVTANLLAHPFKL